MDQVLNLHVGEIFFFFFSYLSVLLLTNCSKRRLITRTAHMCITGQIRDSLWLCFARAMPLAHHHCRRCSYISWMIFECQPSVVRGPKRRPAQMLLTHVVSDAPVPAVCQVRRLFQTKLSKANRSQSVPKQVCDSSTCVSPGIRFSFSCLDKESDLWQNKKKKGSVSSWQAGAIQRIWLPRYPPIPRWCWHGGGLWGGLD